MVALALHASFALKLVQWHDPVPGDDGSEAVLIDLAPAMDAPPSPVQEDLAPEALSLAVEAGRDGVTDGPRKALQILLNCPEFQLA